MTTMTSDVLEKIPLYREGETDVESARRLEMDPVGFHVRAYRQHGPVYRTMMGQAMTVIFSGLETNEFIWKSTDLWTYHDLFVAFREQLGEDHVTAIDGDHHRQKRTMLKPAFDQAPAMRYLPQYNTIFHQEIKKLPGLDKVDLVHYWARVIFKTHLLTVAQAQVSDEVIDQVVAWEKLLLLGLAKIDGEDRHEYYSHKDYVALKVVTMKLLGDMVDDRLAHPDKFDDNFSMVMKARLADGPVDREILIDDLYLVVLAGVENTARLISTCLTWILRDPEWLAGVRSEVDAWDGQDIMAVSRMTRIKATIMEAQRFNPLVFYNPRECTRDFEYGGFRFPAGTRFRHVTILCHYLEEMYPDPLTFKPQRFVEDGKFIAKSNGFFGGGTHICLGRNHAMFQTPIALAQMLKYYNFELLGDAREESFLRAGSALTDLWVRATPRGA